MASDGINTNSSGSGQSASSSALGAVGKILSSLGLGGSNSSNKAVVAALTGLLSAAGQTKANMTASKLPTMPTLPGAAAMGSNGYFNNYSSNGSGNGYAPVTQAPAKPISSYYTYGQGPQQQQFQQVSTTGGTIAPVSVGMKRGGRVTTPQRFLVGGQPMMGAPTPAGVATGVGAGMQPNQMPIARPQAPAQPTQPAQGGALGAMQPAPAQPASGGLLGQMPRPMQPTQMPVQRPAQPMAPQPMTTMGARMAAARTAHMAEGGPAKNPDGTNYQLPQLNMSQSQAFQGPQGKTLAQVRQAAQRQPAMASGGALSGVPGPGQSRHIQGPGDGTSDSIPARLANGEYVIDAQAVSMLGNGDNAAGAKVLDNMRKKLREHKGSQLAKGKMAPDAKPIDKYMSVPR